MDVEALQECALSLGEYYPWKVVGQSVLACRGVLKHGVEAFHQAINSWMVNCNGICSIWRSLQKAYHLYKVNWAPLIEVSVPTSLQTEQTVLNKHATVEIDCRHQISTRD